MADSTERNALLDGIEILSEAKSKVESRVKLLRLLLEDKEIDRGQLRKARILYEEARSRVNAGIDRLLVELESTAAREMEASYRRTSDQAAESMAAFIKTSDEFILGDSRGESLTTVLGLIKSLPTALVDIWKTLHGEKKEQKTRLVNRIELLKWTDFELIGQLKA